MCVDRCDFSRCYEFALERVWQGLGFLYCFLRGSELLRVFSKWLSAFDQLPYFSARTLPAGCMPVPPMMLSRQSVLQTLMVKVLCKAVSLALR